MTDNDLPAHAKLSPSSASMWMTCAGSVEANDGLPDDTSEFAAEGTVAHLISDRCMEEGSDAYDFIGQQFEADGFTFVWDDESAELLQPGIDWLREQPGDFFGEHKVDLSHWLGPDQFGTLDRGLIFCDPATGEWWIVINDLKWGRGVPVQAVRNKQLMLYALGFWWNVARRRIPDGAKVNFRIVIDQPRCAGGGGEWLTTLDELLAFGEEARAAAAHALTPGAPRTASADGCLWCRRRKFAATEPGALSGCKTYDEFMLEFFAMSFDDLDSATEIRMPDDIGVDRRGQILLHRGVIEKWLETLHAQTIADALRGDPTGPVKAVEGRKSPDKFNDPTAAMNMVLALHGDHLTTRKVKTPTQIGKEVPREELWWFDLFVKRGERKPTLVPVEDARPALTTYVDQFETL